jgi:hypothetical protein
MTCNQGAACECVGGMKALCPNFNVPETKRGELDRWSTQNWETVSPIARKVCLDHLRSIVPAEVVAAWKDQYDRGCTIGSNDIGFHHGVGMVVRNTLRAVMSDEDLPPIKQRDGTAARNWDDFYMGALNALVSDGA